MYVCGKCYRKGVLEDGSLCLCRGWGVLNTIKLSASGALLRWEPFLQAIKRIPMSDINEAVLAYRVGFDIEGHELFNLGVVEKLVEKGVEFDQENDGVWLRKILTTYDAVILAPDGIWIERDGQGVCIEQFPAESY